MTIQESNLNAILARWITPARADGADLDCLGCSKPNKCCDFQPFVANFLLGAILERGGKIPQSPNIIFLPLGLLPAPEFRRKRDSTEESERGEDLRCSFLAQGRCAIWNERPGECSTYLCTPPTPARTALSQTAFDTETAISQMALAYQGFSPEEIASQIDFLNGTEHGLKPQPQSEMEAIYRKAWAWARDVKAEDVREWLGQ